MMPANTEYVIGSFFVLAALLSPLAYCAAGWVGQPSLDDFPPRRWFRVALFWAGACGVVMDIACLGIAATFDPNHNLLLGHIDRIDSSFLNGVPTVFLIAIGCYTVALCLVLGLFALKAAATRIGKVLRNEPQRPHRCPLPRRRADARHSR